MTTIILLCMKSGMPQQGETAWKFPTTTWTWKRFFSSVASHVANQILICCKWGRTNSTGEPPSEIWSTVILQLEDEWTRQLITFYTMWGNDQQRNIINKPRKIFLLTMILDFSLRLDWNAHPTPICHNSYTWTVIIVKYSECTERSQYLDLPTWKLQLQSWPKVNHMSCATFTQNTCQSCERWTGKYSLKCSFSYNVVNMAQILHASHTYFCNYMSRSNCIIW
jgi:hypothetical protein